VTPVLILVGAGLVASKATSAGGSRAVIASNAIALCGILLVCSAIACLVGVGP